MAKSTSDSPSLAPAPARKIDGPTPPETQIELSFDDNRAVSALVGQYGQHLALLERSVATSGHLVGDRFTLADINLLPILYYVRQLPEGAVALGPATHLGRYYDRHAERPSFERTTPPPGPPRRAPPTPAATTPVPRS